MEQYMVKCLEKTHPEYPQRLKKLAGMPERLYVKGKLPREDIPTVAIVGARSCTSYGRNMAREYARILSREGIQVISGLALGIDGEAHAGALMSDTPTFAVLAGEVERCYPRSNEKIYHKMLDKAGGILSEHPKGTPSMACYFPARNRIISGLSDVVLVVEARLKSGSLITVDFALEQGKAVFAIPGRVGDVTSEGCNRLIAQGAGIAYSPDMILQEVGMMKPIMAENANHRRVLELSDEAQYVYKQLDQSPISLEDLCRRIPYEIPTISSALLELQMNGIAVEISKNYYVKSSKFQ